VLDLFAAVVLLIGQEKYAAAFQGGVQEGMYSAACLPTSVPGPTGAGRGAARPTSRSTLDVHRTEASAVGEPSAGTATLERVGWIELGV
jgi:hypothetical protein